VAANRLYGTPLFLESLGDHAQTRLAKRIPLNSGGSYNEAWLQRLIMSYPALLPITDIEPALTPIIPLCMELNVPSGFIDNLYATPAGDLIVVETKLWRNPEARREVVGQILDYAKDLSRWTYGELDAAVQSASGRREAEGLSLYKTCQVSDLAEMEEAAFIDQVSRNLRRGRFLLLIVGDGIQEGAEALAEFLQQHAGLHFTLAMIEMAIFELPTAQPSFFVQPRILTRTINIDRGIVSVSDGRVSIVAPATAKTGSSSSAVKRTSISEEKFYEELSAQRQGIAEQLKKFVERVADLGIYAEFGRQSLILRWRPDDAHVWSLAAVLTDGKVWTELHHNQANSLGLLLRSQEHVTNLAAIVPGAYVKKIKPLSWHVDKDGTYVRIEELLNHADARYAELKRYTDDVRAALAAAA
jgi:hypothetical protein